MTTPRLGAPELVQSQAVPETTVNEIARYLEAFATRAIVKDRDLATPPGSPSDGDAYLVAASPTDAWAGQAGKIALRISTAWVFITAKEGFEIEVEDEDAAFTYRGGSWVSSGGSTTIQFPVEEEGVEESATVQRLNFTGNVDVSVAGSEATINIPTPASEVDGLEGSESILRFQYGNGSSGTATQVGLTVSNQGSAAAAGVTSTNRLTRMGRAGRSTTSVAGQEAGLRTSQQIAWREVGFTYEFRGGVETVSGADMRLFIGLRGSTGFFGNADPSTFTNIIGFGLDAADGNVQLMHNDGAGAATKTDTAIAVSAGDEIYVRIHCTAGGDFEVLLRHFAAANLTATPTATYSATVSADIPAASQALAFLHWVNNAATAATATISMARESIRSPI